MKGFEKLLVIWARQVQVSFEMPCYYYGTLDLKIQGCRGRKVQFVVCLDRGQLEAINVMWAALRQVRRNSSRLIFWWVSLHVVGRHQRHSEQFSRLFVSVKVNSFMYLDDVFLFLSFLNVQSSVEILRTKLLNSIVHAVNRFFKIGSIFFSSIWRHHPS